jgi:hypothetical protein
MHWKGCGRKWSWANVRYYLDNCPEKLRKTTKNLIQDSCVPTEIQTTHLPNTSLQYYCCTKLLGKNTTCLWFMYQVYYEGE